MDKFEAANDQAMGIGIDGQPTPADHHAVVERSLAAVTGDLTADLVPLAEPAQLRHCKGTQSLMSVERRPALYNLLQCSDDSLKDLIAIRRKRNEPVHLEVVEWVCWPKSSTNRQTGEIETMIRVSISLADGTSLGCASRGIATSLYEAEYILGRSPWQPPKKFELIELPAAVGSVYKLRLVK